MPGRKTKPDKRVARMYPSLHEDVLKALSPSINTLPTFNPTTEQHPTKTWNSHVMGKFRCISTGCSTHSWPSGQVAIVIRKYADNSYNATVYGQRCKECDSLGVLKLDKGIYVTRVAYWLNKWAGVEVEKPPVRGKFTKPHETEYCEGCKNDVCSRSH